MIGIRMQVELSLYLFGVDCSRGRLHKKLPTIYICQKRNMCVMIRSKLWLKNYLKCSSNSSLLQSRNLSLFKFLLIKASTCFRLKKKNEAYEIQL